MNDDEYEEVKNANDIPTQCPVIDDVSYSTLGSPIDATQITPGPIPDEIEFHRPSCLRRSQYASIQRLDTFPPIPQIFVSLKISMNFKKSHSNDIN
jgi:hypothetical protein